MKIKLDIPGDYEWLEKILQNDYELAQQAVAKGDRPEHAAGYLAAVTNIIAGIESEFQVIAEKVNERMEADVARKRPQ